MHTKLSLPVLFAFLTSIVIGVVSPHMASAARDIVFPVIGSATFTNDFYAARSGGRTHGATDIFAPKHRKLVSAVDGVVTFVGYPQPSYGYIVIIRDSENYTYKYIHINNDTPGTDNGKGGGMRAYAPDMKAGNPVVRGQHIGYLGDSGNAENTPPHLHFEIFLPNGNRANPYQSLVQAKRISSPVNYPQLPNELLPYGTWFKGGLNMAMGNFDTDPESEFVTGAGKGGGPHVKVYDSDNTLTKGFFAYNSALRGGTDVATGDIDGDGTDEIITGAGPGSGPEVKIFEPDGTFINSFLAYTPKFSGGISVAAGDINDDGIDEVITGAGPGGGPHIKIYKPDGTGIKGFFAYNSAFRGGVDVSVGNVVPNTTAEEVITGAGAGGGPHVKIFSGDGTGIKGFFAYNSAFRGGVRVSAGDVKTSTPYDELLTSPWASGGPQLKLYDMSTLTPQLLDSTMFLESWWRGQYDVAAGFGTSLAGAHTNRRATVRAGLD